MFRRTQCALIYNMQTIVITDMVLDQHLTHEEARKAHIFNQVLGQAIDMAMGQKKKPVTETRHFPGAKSRLAWPGLKDFKLI